MCGIDETATLYLFSVFAQVLAALAALLAIFVHYQSSQIQVTLIGFGRNILSRWKEGHYDEKKIIEMLDWKLLQPRLRDAIDSGSLVDIRSVIVAFAESYNSGNQGPRSFKSVLTRFDRGQNRLAKLQLMARSSIVLAVFGILSACIGITALQLRYLDLVVVVCMISWLFFLATLFVISYTAIVGLNDDWH